MAGEEGEDDENLPKDKFMCNKSKTKKNIDLSCWCYNEFYYSYHFTFYDWIFYGSTEQSSVIGLFKAEAQLKMRD